MLTSQFKALIALLQAQLRAIQESLEKQERAARDGQKSREAQWREIPRIISAIRPAHREIADAQARHQENYRQEDRSIAVQKGIRLAGWMTAVATALAFVAAGYYATQAHKQLSKMEEANRATRCANLVSFNSTQESSYYSREEERAWVGIWAPPGPNALMISNPGKTVARNVVVFVRTVSGERRFGPVDISPYTELPAPLLFPEGLPPDQKLRGRITYTDAFGVDHWARFCYLFGAKGGVSPCQTGNEEDHELENPPTANLPEECKQSSSPAS